MKTEIISFYSDVDGTTYYSDCAKRLAPQLTALDIPHDIRDKPSLGSYQKNCLSKPLFIASMLAEKKKPVVWLDVDASVIRTMEMLDSYEGNTDIGIACSQNNIMTAIPCMMYFGYTDASNWFLNEWISMCNALLEVGKWFDHEAMLSIIHNCKDNPNIRFKVAGPNYCVWPGHENDSSVVVLGLSDADSKKEKLRELGFNEESIEWQSPGIK